MIEKNLRVDKNSSQQRHMLLISLRFLVNKSKRPALARGASNKEPA
jgi:hypothetical protein